MTEYSWDNSEVNRERLMELQKYNETRWSKNGVCIIDDTLIEKTGKHIPATGKYFDHAKHRYVYGHSIVSLHYADNKTNYAIDYRLYLKQDKYDGFKTKIELAKELIQDSINIGIPASTYVFDSWYLCGHFTRFIESFKRFWIGACKTNLLVRTSSDRYVSIKEYAESVPKDKFKQFEVNGKGLLIHTKNLYFKSLGKRARLVISKDGKNTLYLVTNRRDHVTKILADYMLRCKIDGFYKDAKQHLGLGKCQLRNIEGIKKHWHLVFLAHSILRLGVSESMLGRTILASSIGQRVKRTCIGLLEKLIGWVVEGGKRMEDIMELLGRFIYRQS
jgi:hypothetical protein